MNKQLLGLGKVRILVSSLVVVAVWMAVSGVASAASAQSPCQKQLPAHQKDCTRVLAIVHRGGKSADSITNEDTLKNFKLTYRAYNDIAEADLWPLQENGVKASSNVLAYNHDDTVKRTIDPATLVTAGIVNANQTIITITPEQWAKLRTNGGAKVSTFQQVTEWACSRPRQFRMLNEVKYEFKDPAAIVQQIKNAGCNGQIWFYQKPNASTNCSVKGIDGLRAAAQAAGVKIKFGIKTDGTGCVLSADQLAGYDFVAAAHTLLTKQWISDVHAKGVPIIDLTSTDKTGWKQDIRRGIGSMKGDGIITNGQNKLSKWLGNQQ